MGTRLIKEIIIISVLLFATISTSCAQQANKEEYSEIPIDNIYLENKDNQLALNKITSKNIQNLLGRPMKIDRYEEKWSDEYNKTTIYRYKLLTICFRSLEEEWLESIECLSSDVFITVNGIRLFVGQKDSVLNVFEKSWKVYQELENTKYYQDNMKRGSSEKTLIIEFPIKKGNYEYHGSVFISTKNGIIEKIRISMQDPDNI